jgi:hypothetical protein
MFDLGGLRKIECQIAHPHECEVEGCGVPLHGLNKSGVWKAHKGGSVHKTVETEEKAKKAPDFRVPASLERRAQARLYLNTMKKVPVKQPGGPRYFEVKMSEEAMDLVWSGLSGEQKARILSAA